MTKIDEIKKLISELEVKLKEFKDELFPEEIIINKNQLEEIELVIDTDYVDYLKFREFKFVSSKKKSSFNNLSISSEIVKDIKNGTLKSITLKKYDYNDPKDRIGLNSIVIDVSRSIT
jgi:hypothetical protein